MRGPSRKVKAALEKARDSALLAVEVYNKPAVKFKSGGYITLMVIAWTALFHAIFFKKKCKPFCKEHGRFLRIDNDFKHWELGECLSQYFKTDTGNPVRKNLEFFIPLRNRIEHRSMPELDKRFRPLWEIQKSSVAESRWTNSTSPFTCAVGGVAKRGRPAAVLLRRRQTGNSACTTNGTTITGTRRHGWIS